MYVSCLHASVWGVNGGRWNNSKGISSCCSMVVTFIIQTYITGTNYVIENVCAEESYNITISCILYIGTNFTPLRWSDGVIAYCELHNITVHHAS